MASLEEIREINLKKLQALKDKGVDPYPISVSRDISLKDVADNFEKIDDKKSLHLAGRIMALRPQGGLVFFHFDDGTGRFQGLIKEDEMDKEAFSLWQNTVGIGDFVEVKGSLFITKRGEKTIKVSEWKMLAKTLRPLPEKWHGLQDVEERFRKRYLDILMSGEVKERFVLRSKIVSSIRAFLNKAGFLEVETPILQVLAGGATALPFKTRHNALDLDMYLRIAPELYLKRLLVGGFPKVYEIGRNFRNEGIDVSHNPEFTMLEFYEAYSDAEKEMAFVEKLIKFIAKEALEKDKFEFEGNEISLSKKFARVSYYELLQRYALIENPEKVSLEELKLKAAQLGVKVEEGDGTQKILDNIYKKMCRPKLIQPAFITDYPASYLPLAKRKPENPELVDAFQLVMGGVEIAKAFSELNDPIDQRERFKKEEEAKSAGDKEAQPNDEEFLEALEYGMPPAGGVGIGIERLMIVMSGVKNIREVMLFPTLRPKFEEKPREKKSEEEKEKEK